ncbi:MAG: hypothetical protein KCHDKBKB_02838 [Elusimicrobia bacterium]|nr:hypothetical protein [Elusimicrobiota bacterium]
MSLAGTQVFATVESRPRPNSVPGRRSFGVFIQALRGVGLLAYVAMVFMLAATQAKAETTQTFSKWVKDIKWSGDLRLRGEMFDKKTAGQVDRSRLRFRLRLNTDVKLPNNFMAKFTLASGTGEQTSTNQSFDNLSSQKSIYIDKIYLTWAPLEALKFQAGRMENPLWRPYSADAIWDTDFNPEGFSESYSQLVGPVNIFVNALQMVVDEDSGNNATEALTTTTSQSAGPEQRDQWMIGNQVGAEVKLPLESRFKFAYANYDWINERYGDMGAVVNNEGNRRFSTSTGTVINNFNVHEFTGVLSSWIFRTPVLINGTYMENSGARGDINPKENTGWQLGGIVGKAGTKNGWEVAYFRKHVRTDATIADVADADFGDGGTNREGNIFWVAYSPQDWILLQAKYFQTKVINTALLPRADDINRLQLDFTVKF